MKQVDYIIVGLGIGGIAIAETLRKQNKTFILFDDTHKGATVASGGVLNPTVLKRFTAAWNIDVFLPEAVSFFNDVNTYLGANICKPQKVFRILTNTEEQNNWVTASDKPSLQAYLDDCILKNDNKAIHAPYGLASVKNAYQLHPSLLINAYRNALMNTSQVEQVVFDYAQLKYNATGVTYQNYTAKHIIFAEGAHVINNPLFPVAISPAPPKVFVPNKGVYIIVKAPALQCNAILKGPVMVIPLGNDLYKVGATYGRDETNATIPSSAIDELTAKLATMIHCNFTVESAVTGVRPTVKDRKPIIGPINKNNSIVFFNGLGTRGLTMAPLLAKQLIAYLENKQPLDKAVDIQRFLT